MSDLPSLIESFRERLFGYKYEHVQDASAQRSPRSKVGGTSRPCIYYAGAIAAAIFTAVLLLLLLQDDSDSALAEAYLEIVDDHFIRARVSDHWHGWPSIRHMVVFGDSWSMTGFNVSDAAPSLENPLGNPPWPGETSTNGANWIDYLTYSYNDSLVFTANFAIGGATVDESMIPAAMPHKDGRLGGLKSQIEEFTSLYADSPNFEWQVDSSLFVIWIGINDIHEAYLHPEFDARFPSIMHTYATEVDTLYALGARNFLFVTVPPIERAPISEGAEDYIDQAVATFNKNVTALAWNFTTTYDDVSAFLFDAHELFERMIEDPCILPMSCGIETVEYCLAYSFGTITTDPDCPHTIDGYLWMNPLHPTTVAHDATAFAVVRALNAVASSGGTEQERG